MRPLVTVIIPAYNVEKYITKCINSVIKQTYKKLEIIVINDGSTDKTSLFCEECAKKDSRIIVVNKENGGLSSARNAGLDIAHGEYVGFVDGDDFIDPEMYDRLLNACLKNDIKLSTCGRCVLKQDGTTERQFVLNEEKVFDSKDGIKNLLLWRYFDSSVCDKLFKIDLFSDLRFPLRVISEDIPITARLFYRTEKIAHVGKPLYYYVKHAGTLSKEGFTEKRLNVINQVYNMTGFVQKNIPELFQECSFFIGEQLYALQQKALESKNLDKDLLSGLIKECNMNIIRILKCRYFGFKRKMKYLKNIIKLVFIKL